MKTKDIDICRNKQIFQKLTGISIKEDKNNIYLSQSFVNKKYFTLRYR